MGVVAALLDAWRGGGLRAWRREAHALFPAAFRADVAAALLATLGSHGAAAIAAGPAASSAVAVSCGTRQQRNPLRMLRDLHLLDAVFQALLLAHMGGAAAVQQAPLECEPAPPPADD